MYRYIRVVLILFGISLTALFIQHHVELSTSEFRSEQTSKDVYYPPNSRYRGLQTTRQEFQEYFINVRLSDDIPVNRDIPDSRPDSCRNPGASQLTVSIVITFYREWPSILLRTVYSVVYRTQNLQQIILVDDGNDETGYRDILNHIRKTFRDVVKVVSLHRRFGLIGARLEGVKHVTGHVICFLDSHMEVNINWSIPLLNIIDENPNAVAMSQLDDINPNTFKYTFSKTYRTRYGFDWRLRFFETEFRQEQLKHGDLVLPGVLAVGSAFAIRKEFFREIGMYDAGLKIWGGENLELSFKVWLCGGKLVHVTCSRIGHITRSQPYLQNNRLDIEMHNYKRVADVWMDNFASYVYDNYPRMKSLSVGGLSKQWRQRRRCKPFSWFLDNIWPELFQYKDSSSSVGSIMNTNGAGLCIDNQGHLFSSPLRITVKPCSNDTKTQLFGLTTDSRLRTNLQCVFVKKEVFDLVPYIQNCYEQPQDTFNFTKGQRRRTPKLSCSDYRILMNLLSRREVIPVKERNSLEKRLYKKISHFNFGKQLIIDPYLGKQTNRITIDGKIVLPWEELDKCIEKFYTLSKADGARKLYHQIKEHYFGIGEPMIQRYISNNDMQRQKRPLFSNKAPLIPVDAKQPMERHQVDLVDMRKLIVEKDDVSYKYILSTMDVFTRFVWLRSLSDKSSEKVAAKLREIYAEFGNPKILQSDQGSEFKGVATRLCKDMNIKLIYSSSYHPQSQGKIERSHGTWKDKIRFDLINSKFGGICDWVTNLPNLQSIYNNAVHRLWEYHLMNVYWESNQIL